MTCLIRFREPKCLVGLTYVPSITKFELHKGMKKKFLIAQGMELGEVEKQSNNIRRRPCFCHRPPFFFFFSFPPPLSFLFCFCYLRASPPPPSLKAQSSWAWSSLAKRRKGKEAFFPYHLHYHHVVIVTIVGVVKGESTLR